MLNHTKSAKLTLYLTDIIFVAALVTAVFLPDILGGWFLNRGDVSFKLFKGMLVICYTCLPIALLALISLRFLLKNIIKGEIFIKGNINQLNYLFICCLLVSLITMVSGIILYPPFSIIGIAAGFFSLILRVIKNVFRTAMEIKSENELTI